MNCSMNRVTLWANSREWSKFTLRNRLGEWVITRKNYLIY